MDPIRMLRTCHVFPIWRRMSDEQEDETVGLDEQVYDPLFVTLLVAQTLAHHPPALRHLNGSRRCEASLGLLARVWKSVEPSEMQEKQHALYIFNSLKNLVKPSSDGPPSRLPSFAVIFYPSNFIYPRTARFLLQHPELDVTDVPMLYGILYGSSDDWKKGRGWIVRFLSDGMMTPSLPILQQAARVTLRSSLASQTSTFHLSQVLTTALGILEQLEACIDFSKSSSINGPAIPSKPPYHGYGLHIQLPITDPLRAWGNIVEDLLLWRASMTLDENSAPLPLRNVFRQPCCRGSSAWKKFSTAGSNPFYTLFILSTRLFSTAVLDARLVHFLMFPDVKEEYFDEKNSLTRPALAQKVLQVDPALTPVQAANQPVLKIRAISSTSTSVLTRMSDSLPCNKTHALRRFIRQPNYPTTGHWLFALGAVINESVRDTWRLTMTVNFKVSASVQSEMSSR
ncbi:hypothetical protein DEU56DRAFT_931988 [Suillus clintonianus]|uniref:uncharacterized protein n=1 Tax=Suillus clintonianus TaxID=1904413 RepID=UPI001B86641B|nr:uncharacterized protein DEU56DRAFT_931988 [Suillus clintonianus]KAG2146227.1 hypothetical protein DEU56DRAFT_931988 [Suillus clintonianus]